MIFTNLYIIGIIILIVTVLVLASHSTITKCERLEQLDLQYNNLSFYQKNYITEYC